MGPDEDSSRSSSPDPLMQPQSAEEESPATADAQPYPQSGRIIVSPVPEEDLLLHPASANVMTPVTETPAAIGNGVSITHTHPVAEPVTDIQVLNQGYGTSCSDVVIHVIDVNEDVHVWRGDGNGMEQV